MNKPDKYLPSFTDNHISLLTLQSLPGCGPATQLHLIWQFGSASAALEAHSDELAPLLAPDTLKALIRWRKRQHSGISQQIQTQLDWLAQHNIALVTQQDASYPALLQEISCPPPILYVAGNVDLLQTQQLAIVGSRKATPAGIELAQAFAAELGMADFTITSGLALGIDAAAHKGALQQQTPTIAVIATGIDLCYPRRHNQLCEIIKQQGAVVSEFAPGTAALRENFPRRNRIISGLSLGIVVVEAQPGSGSLITARYAIEQNREVFAVPGSVRSPNSRGCHDLIKQGAALVESSEDILDALGCPCHWSPVAIGEPDSQSLKPEAAQLLNNIPYDAITLDELVEYTGKPVEIILPILLQLEISGYLDCSETGYSRRR